jgi:hypothetical protein
VDESGRVVPAPRPEKEPKPKAEALDYEAITGDKSAQRIAQERGHAIIQNAGSWPELHQKLAAVGLRFEKKGSGAIIFVGETAVKASSVDRAFSMGKLCKRLGEFVPGDYAGETEPAMPKIGPEPVSPAHLEDWKEYRAECEKTPAQQPDSPQPTIQAELKRRHKLERKRLARRLAGKNLSVINHARHGLAMKQREERRAATVPRPRPGRRRQSFKAWLLAHGRNQQADRWRYRNRQFSPTPPPPPLDTKPSEALSAYAAHWEIQRQKNARLATLAAGMALFGKVLSPPPESSSRLDAKVALFMRMEGHSRENVTEAIRLSAPELRGEEKRDWRRYAGRTVNYAFGMAGDMELARLPRQEQRPVEPLPPQPDPHEHDPQQETPRLRMR